VGTLRVVVGTPGNARKSQAMRCRDGIVLNCDCSKALNQFLTLLLYSVGYWAVGTYADVWFSKLVRAFSC
jgi:hypothetical protein